MVPTSWSSAGPNSISHALYLKPYLAHGKNSVNVSSYYMLSPNMLLFTCNLWSRLGSKVANLLRRSNTIYLKNAPIQYFQNSIGGKKKNDITLTNNRSTNASLKSKMLCGNDHIAFTIYLLPTLNNSFWLQIISNDLTTQQYLQNNDQRLSWP